MKSLRIPLLGCFGAAVLVAAHAEPTAAFSLIPKSLQKNPRLDFTYSSELTDAGRQLAAQPGYYAIQAGKLLQTGLGGEAMKAPDPERLQALMVQALAARGYAPGNPAGHAPTMLIVYNWGASSYLPPATVGDRVVTADAPLPMPAQRRALLDRVQLLGGEKFAAEVAAALDESEKRATAQRDFRPPDGPAGVGVVGDPTPDPLEQLRMKSREHQRLVDELFSSSYFVVASAYDYAALAKGQHVLLWRTKMTVNATGANLAESIPSLIAEAGPYFGTETKAPVVVSKRIARDGSVAAVER